MGVRRSTATCVALLAVVIAACGDPSTSVPVPNAAPPAAPATTTAPDDVFSPADGSAEAGVVEGDTADLAPGSAPDGATALSIEPAPTTTVPSESAPSESVPPDNTPTDPAATVPTPPSSAPPPASSTPPSPTPPAPPTTPPTTGVPALEPPRPATPAIEGDTPEVARPGTIAPSRELADPAFGATAGAFDRLARGNAAASLTVVRDGQIVWSAVSGTTIDGQPARSDSPMVVASVSKFVVAVGVTRLEALGRLNTEDPVPWSDMGLSPDAAWNDVRIRELLDHTGGLSKARPSWFTGEGSCRSYIPSLLGSAPNSHRGRWVYSNGNFCLLGLLLEAKTGLPLDQALQQLVFDPIGVDGIHLTDGGLAPGDVAYAPGVARLSRLGGAGTLVVSTDDVALLAGQLALGDRFLLRPPGMFTDQYGYGHTGTIEGAKSCVWLLDGGSTVVAATVAGNSPASGGGVCDRAVPAVATDLGINAGRPDRTP